MTASSVAEPCADDWPHKFFGVRQFRLPIATAWQMQL
jgi:hypothetical protein